MGKKSKLAIGIVVIVGAASVLGMSAAKRGNKAVEVRMETVQKREANCGTLASFVVEDGKPGAVRSSA